MPMIYRAANVVEAQLIVDELQACGLQSHVTGSYLSGAIGELPPEDVIGVWLEEPLHEARARTIIDEFEARRNRPPQDWLCNACGEWLGREFGACWQCGRTKPVNR